jgi:hypothetical protein
MKEVEIMREIIVALLQNFEGVSLLILMTLAIAAFTIWYGFYMISLPAISLVSAGRIMLESYGNRSYLVVSPQLGLTMDDGGDRIEKEE